MEYLKLFWKHDLDNEPVVILYEVDVKNERLANRSIDVFKDRNTKNIENPYENVIEILTIPKVKEFNSHLFGKEFLAELITKEEFEKTWNEQYYHEKLDK